MVQLDLGLKMIRISRHSGRFFLLLLLWLAAATEGLAAMDAWGERIEIPDSSLVRRQYSDLLELPANELKNEKKQRIIHDPSGGANLSLQINTSRSDWTEFSFLYARDGKFRIDVPGSVVLRRKTESGGITLMRLTLRSSPYFFMEVEPQGNRGKISVYMNDYHTVLYKDIRISLSPDRLARFDMANLEEMTKARIDWDLLLSCPDASYYDESRYMMALIRRNLPLLPDADDGALDENGSFVKISGTKLNNLPGLNCSGFAKWIADGLYKPLTGRYLSIQDMKKRDEESRAHLFASAYEEERDPFFGLDWIRNIATSLHSARIGRPVTDLASRDVQNVDFVPYLANKGFESKDLDLALYILAQTEPGNFYLAAVNGQWGKEPRLWQYYHIVALFPYFDAQGTFRTVVFERNVETSLASLHKRYPEEFFNLVRIKASKGFIPPPIP